MQKPARILSRRATVACENVEKGLSKDDRPARITSRRATGDGDIDQRIPTGVPAMDQHNPRVGARAIGQESTSPAQVHSQYQHMVLRQAVTAEATEQGKAANSVSFTMYQANPRDPRIARRQASATQAIATENQTELSSVTSSNQGYSRGSRIRSVSQATVAQSEVPLSFLCRPSILSAHRDTGSATQAHHTELAMTAASDQYETNSQFFRRPSFMTARHGNESVNRVNFLGSTSAASPATGSERYEANLPLFGRPSFMPAHSDNRTVAYANSRRVGSEASTMRNAANVPSFDGAAMFTRPFSDGMTASDINSDYRHGISRASSVQWNIENIPPPPTRQLPNLIRMYDLNQQSASTHDSLLSVERGVLRDMVDRQPTVPLQPRGTLPRFLPSLQEDEDKDDPKPNILTHPMEFAAHIGRRIDRLFFDSENLNE